MNKETITFHRQVIRHLKGICTAYELWIKEKEKK
jgi:hypothetical protein